MKYLILPILLLASCTPSGADSDQHPSDQGASATTQKEVQSPSPTSQANPGPTGHTGQGKASGHGSSRGKDP